MQDIRETQVRSLGQEDPLEKKIATHFSILAWEIPWTEKPSRLPSMGSQELDMTERLIHHHQSNHEGMVPWCLLKGLRQQMKMEMLTVRTRSVVVIRLLSCLYPSGLAQCTSYCRKSSLPWSLRKARPAAPSPPRPGGADSGAELGSSELPSFADAVRKLSDEGASFTWPWGITCFWTLPGLLPSQEEELAFPCLCSLGCFSHWDRSCSVPFSSDWRWQRPYKPSA